MSYKVTNPATGEVLRALPADSVQDVAQTVLQARNAQPEWEARGFAGRATCLRALRNTLKQEADAFAALLVDETGKTLTEAHAMEVLPLLEACDVWASRAEEALESQPLSSRVGPHKETTLRYEPRGVVGVICPWNFPLAIGGTEAVMALMAGNAVVLKPSEHAPLALMRFVEEAHRCGIPEAVFSIASGAGAVGRALMTPEDEGDVGATAPEVVDFVAFTGSTSTGRDVAAHCGLHLIPCRVELGGKATAVVLADADIDRTAAAIAWGAFCHSGQVCAGVQRVFVHRSCQRALELALKTEVSHRRALRATHDDNEVGYLRLEGTSALVAELTNDALACGGHLLNGAVPQAEERRGHAVVVTGASPSARIWREECFGPLLSIAAFDSDDELVDAANASPFGLMGAVFSEDKARAKMVADKLKIATVMVNDVVWAYGMSEIPWFGRKTSGLGFSHGDEGLRELCHAQVVVEERARVLTREPFWYPYSSARLRALRLGTAALYGAAQARDKVRGALSRWTRPKGRKGDSQ